MLGDLAKMIFVAFQCTQEKIGAGKGRANILAGYTEKGGNGFTLRKGQFRLDKKDEIFLQ